jgi:GxxExxY protein
LNHGDKVTHSSTEKTHEPLSAREIWLAAQIVDIAIQIHKLLGPGLLESVYEKVFCHFLQKRGIPFRKQVMVEIIVDGLVIDEGLRIDIIIDDLIIIELKAQDVPHPVWDAQVLSYLRLTSKRLGYILNFHVPLMKNGIKRLII